MKLSKSSWHVGLNDYVWGDGYSIDQNNLCPYFWGTIAAIFCCIPVLIRKAIGDSISGGTSIFLLRYGLGIFWIGLGIVLLAPVTFGVGVGILVFNLILYNTNIFGRLAGWIRGKHKERPKKPYKERKPHMTVEMFKGWKNKHCPMVEWE